MDDPHPRTAVGQMAHPVTRDTACLRRGPKAERPKVLKHLAGGTRQRILARFRHRRSALATIAPGCRLPSIANIGAGMPDGNALAGL